MFIEKFLWYWLSCSNKTIKIEGKQLNLTKWTIKKEYNLCRWILFDIYSIYYLWNLIRFVYKIQKFIIIINTMTFSFFRNFNKTICASRLTKPNNLLLSYCGTPVYLCTSREPSVEHLNTAKSLFKTISKL